MRGSFVSPGKKAAALAASRATLPVYFNWILFTGMIEAFFCKHGLPADDPFWADPDAPWTAQKIWNGMDAPADHSYTE
ncbi:hypothetical protein JW906_02965 [bacterium]|nr:hypothetical protein [bacterium]